ncbi:MAG: AMP-binding protein, partial [Hydrogenophaga sp.]|uniref:AMP-binding protein n=1 Tax=Hydrogenophaga sp. TaxID=1904254 RepID=UPI002ABA1014
MEKTDAVFNSSRWSEAQLHDVVRQTRQDLHPDTASLPTSIQASSSLDRDLGFDSLGRMELLLRIESATGIALPEDTLEKAETVGDLWAAWLRGCTQPATANDQVPPSCVATPVAPIAAVTTSPGAPSWDSAQTLLEVLDAHLAAHPDQVQIVYLADKTETPISYRQLYEASTALAMGLQLAGLEPGQTVAIMLPTSPAYFFTYLGILRAGGVPVPIYPPARPSQLEDHVNRHTGILANAQAALLISVPEAMKVARLLQARVPGMRTVRTPEDLIASGQGHPLAAVAVRATDVAFIQYTSGSTGQPKGVALTHANLLANIRAMANAIEATSQDVFVSWLPLYHDMGLIGCVLSPFWVSMPMTYIPTLTFVKHPTIWMETIHQTRACFAFAPNFAYALAKRRTPEEKLARLDLSCMKVLGCGAEPNHPDTLRAFLDHFGKAKLDPKAILPCYGMAEATLAMTFRGTLTGMITDVIDADRYHAEQRAVPTVAAADNRTLEFVSCGKPFSGHAVKIMSDDGRVLEDRCVGEIVYSGPSVTPGYY